MAKLSRRRSGAIEIQISAHVTAPRNGRPMSAAVIRDAIHYRIERGHDPDGIELRIVRWRHRGKPWTSRDSTNAWTRFGRLLQVATIYVHQTWDRPS